MGVKNVNVILQKCYFTFFAATAARILPLMGFFYSKGVFFRKHVFVFFTLTKVKNSIIENWPNSYIQVITKVVKANKYITVKTQ